MPSEDEHGYYFEVYSHEKKWFWRLKTAQNRVIGKCEKPYKTKSSCKAAVDKIVSIASTAEIKVHA